MPKCEYQYNQFGEECWVEITQNYGSLEEPKHYCVLHAPVGLKPISVDELPETGAFLLELLSQWNKKNLELKEKDQPTESFSLPGIRCGEFVCPDGYEFTGDIDFKNAIFMGKVSFQGANFFGSVDFIKSTFIEDTIFSYAKFHDTAHFQYATFRRNCHFEETKFLK